MPRGLTDPRASNSARTSLAAKQRLLVAALVENSDPPVEFDAQQIALAAESLARKRARGVAKAWPDLVAALGEQYPARFADYARAHPPAAGGALPDGRGFARWLQERQQLPHEARHELRQFDLQYRVEHGKLVRRFSRRLRMFLQRLLIK